MRDIDLKPLESLFRAELFKFFKKRKIWRDDPLICPECMGRMKRISFITEGPIIQKILKHLDLWEKEIARAPPPKSDTPEIVWIPIEDVGWEYPDQPDVAG